MFKMRSFRDGETNSLVSPRKHSSAEACGGRSTPILGVGPRGEPEASSRSLFSLKGWRGSYHCRCSPLPSPTWCLFHRDHNKCESICISPCFPCTYLCKGCPHRLPSECAPLPPLSALGTEAPTPWGEAAPSPL